MGKTSVLRDAIFEVNGPKESISKRVKSATAATIDILKQMLIICGTLWMILFLFIEGYPLDKAFSDLINIKLTNFSPDGIRNLFNYKDSAFYIFLTIPFIPVFLRLAGMAIYPLWQWIAYIFNIGLYKLGQRTEYKKSYWVYKKRMKDRIIQLDLFSSIVSTWLVIAFFFYFTRRPFDYQRLVVIIFSILAFLVLVYFFKYFDWKGTHDKIKYALVNIILSVFVLISLVIFECDNIFILGVFIFFIVYQSKNKNQLGEAFYGTIWIFFQMLFNLSFFCFIPFIFYKPYLGSKYITDTPLEIVLSVFNYANTWISLIAGALIAYFLLTLIYFFHDLVQNTISHIDKKIFTISKTQYQIFEINLSQDNIDEREVLKRINDKILEYWRLNASTIDTFRFNRLIYKPWQFIISWFTSGFAEPPSTYQRVLRKLQELKRRMSGSVSISQEQGSNPNLATSIATGFTRLNFPIGKITDRNTINYPVATSKEAEDSLIDIMKSICDYRAIHKSIPDFLFIIDELDKIEPQSSGVLDERELSNPAMDITNLNLPGSREYRKRQEAVARLLANLKGFLNVAQSKFFFIGGRELFDADLADIADRDSFYSSIFNDVIYVDSFYKDLPKGDSSGGITKLIETYLLRLILNREENEKELTLRTLREKITDNKIVVASSNGQDSDTLFKIISLLQNYIVYLTYRSTGSPKKLTSLIEHLLVSHSLSDIENRDDSSIILHELGKTRNEGGVFLRFNYTTQYEINLTTDIIRPYLISNSRFLTNLGDKLLFSTPFIFDHIIKFYPYGFSWRNIELIPEVVLVNKEPYLRDHIKSILDYLSKYHIKQAVSGLYDYKFHSIVRKELAILSKRSDLAAAAFNFTLDESLLVKRHYKKKLMELKEKYQNYKPLDGDNQFIHSLSFVQTILGDLYFYDKEYDEAILYYTESIQSLRLPNGIDNRFLTRHQFLLWLRNKLKIGLTLEKIEAFDSAISLYRTLMIDSERYLRRIVNSNIDTYQETVHSRNDLNNLVIKTSAKPQIGGIDPRSESHRNMHLITLPFIAKLAAIEKNRADGIEYASLYQNKEELRSVIEPVYNDDFLNAEHGHNDRDLHLLRSNYRKTWLWSNYFGSVGSILFYKNCQFTRFFTPFAWDNYDRIFEDNNTLKYRTGYSEFESDEKNNEDKKFDKKFYLKTNFPKLFELLHNQYGKSLISSEGKRESDFFPSLTSICYYWEALNELVSYHSHRLDISISRYRGGLSKKFNPLQYAALYLLPDHIDMVNGRRFYYLANIVSKIGDAVLASFDSKSKSSASLSDIIDYDAFRSRLEGEDKNVEKFIHQILDKLEITNFFSFLNVLRIYALANQLYRRSGNNYYYTFGQKRILAVIKEIVSIRRSNEFALSLFKEEVSNISKSLCLKIIKSTSWYNSISNRAQINKYRDILDWQEMYPVPDFEKNTKLFNSTGNHGDVLEAIITSESILKILSKGSSSEHFQLKSTDLAHNKYVRLWELKYHVECQFAIIIDKFKVDRIYFVKKISLTELSKKEIKSVRSIIFDALFAIRESIKIIQMYEPGYLIGYSLLAVAHHWAGEWCRLAKNLPGNFNDDIKKVLGANSFYFFDSKYQYEMAIQNYYIVLQMHSEGIAYKSKLSNLYALEDDYNDSLTHYNLAFERYMVNTGEIRKRINLLIDRTKESKLHQYENYITMDRKGSSS